MKDLIPGKLYRVPSMLHNYTLYMVGSTLHFLTEEHENIWFYLGKGKFLVNGHVTNEFHIGHFQHFEEFNANGR